MLQGQLKSFLPRLVAFIMKKIPNGFRVQVSKNTPEEKWEVLKSLNDVSF